MITGVLRMHNFVKYTIFQVFFMLVFTFTFLLLDAPCASRQNFWRFPTGSQLSSFYRKSTPHCVKITLPRVKENKWYSFDLPRSNFLPSGSMSFTLKISSNSTPAILPAKNLRLHALSVAHGNKRSFQASTVSLRFSKLLRAPHVNVHFFSSIFTYQFSLLAGFLSLRRNNRELISNKSFIFHIINV